MTSLTFAIDGARCERFAAAPLLTLQARVAERSRAAVYAIALRAQVRIEPQRRRYAADESARLRELFGGPERYGDTLRPLLWTHVAQTIVAFEGEAAFDLPIPCSYDFEVAAHKYLAALDEGAIPLALLFSGTIFVRGPHGVAAELVPWSCEASYRLPVAVWRETMDRFFPNSAWIRVDRETFDALARYKAEGGFPTWESAFARLCPAVRSPR